MTTQDYTYDPERLRQSPEHNAGVRFSVVTQAVRNLYEQIPADLAPAVEPTQQVLPRAATAVVGILDRAPVEATPEPVATPALTVELARQQTAAAFEDQTRVDAGFDAIITREFEHQLEPA